MTSVTQHYYMDNRGNSRANTCTRTVCAAGLLSLRGGDRARTAYLLDCTRQTNAVCGLSGRGGMDSRDRGGFMITRIESRDAFLAEASDGSFKFLPYQLLTVR